MLCVFLQLTFLSRHLLLFVVKLGAFCEDILRGHMQNMLFTAQTLTEATVRLTKLAEYQIQMVHKWQVV